MTRRALLLLVGLTTSACRPADTGVSDAARWEACNASGCLRLHGGGWFDLLDRDGEMVLQHAVGRLRLDDPGEEGTELTTESATRRVISEGQAGQLQLLAFHDGQPDLCWTLRAHPDGWFEAELAFTNRGSEPVLLAKASPVLADGRDDGGLFLGAHPSSHRILENGSYAALDFVAELVPGDVEQNEGYAIVMPGAFEGSSVSSWNHAVQDLDSDKAWVAGALSFERTTPVAGISYKPTRALEDEQGRTGFSHLATEGAYLPDGKPLAPGESLASERYFFWTGADALAGLEIYATAIAENLELVPWHKREADRRVPNGWNSWAGSGSTGGYGTDIDEEIILENLAIMASELRDWGIDWFQLDDGYEPTYGDWWWNKERFPHGPAWLTEQIRDAGLIPGLWMAPFQVYPDAPALRRRPGRLRGELGSAGPVPLGLQRGPDHQPLHAHRGRRGGPPARAGSGGAGHRWPPAGLRVLDRGAPGHGGGHRQLLHPQPHGPDPGPARAPGRAPVPRLEQADHHGGHAAAGGALGRGLRRAYPGLPRRGSQ